MSILLVLGHGGDLPRRQPNITQEGPSKQSVKLFVHKYINEFKYSWHEYFMKSWTFSSSKFVF